MTARHALRPVLAAWPRWFGPTLLLLVSLNLGCVDLKQPSALAHPAGNVAGSSGGGKGGSTFAGSGGATSAGGTSASAMDAGQGGSTISSSSDSDSQGGNSAIDAASGDTGGSGSEGGTGGGGTGGGGTGGGGTGGQTETAGSTGTGSGAGAGGTATGGKTAGTTGTGSGAGTGGAATGGTGGVAGTSGKGGSTGQTSVVPDAGPDAPDTARDTLPPDAYCALCAIGANLVHRYTFNGSGTTITDSVGTANGTATGASLSGSGTLVLAGGTSNQYATLPAHIFNTLTSATLEIWVTWNGSGSNNNNQRILDFGSNKTSGSTTTAVTTVIISPNTYLDNTARLRASYCSDTSVADSSKFVDATSALATGSQQQIVAVFDGQAKTLTMYLNGVAQGTAATGVGALSSIDDVNNYLGKSQYSGDPGFNGTYHEFRIYNAALTAAQVQAVYTAGKDASFN